MLQSLRARLRQPTVIEKVVSDFEAAIWQAVRQVFSESVEHRGCVFHWTQAVWRQVQNLGLAATYMQRDATHRYCRRIMSLPFLPSAAIPDVFYALKGKAESPALTSLVEYVERTWIASTMWPPAVWSVYRCTVRTNNDCESWHSYLNRKAVTGNLPLYKLIDLLHHDSQKVELSLQLLSEDKAQRLQRRVTTEIQAQLENAWDEYDAGVRDADGLLRSCSRIYTKANERPNKK